MVDRIHQYAVEVVWTGNRGEGTRDYQAYGRDHEIIVEGRPSIPGSSDPAFRGDPSRHNPEVLLVAALSACHMLWYLHFCADLGIVVTAYRDAARGVMQEGSSGSGRFAEVVLRPTVVIESGGSVDVALNLHARAHEFCFIANSVNFPVLCEAAVDVVSA